MTTADIIPANIILAQLGGARRLTSMVGLKCPMFADEGDTLILPIMRGMHVRITLDHADDTYTIAVDRVRWHNVKRGEPVSGVYADSLFRVLEAETGLAWRL